MARVAAKGLLSLLCACDNGHLIYKTCHCQVLVEPRHQYWISAVAPQTSFCKRPVVAPSNVGYYLRLQGLLIRIYWGADTNHFAAPSWISSGLSLERSLVKIWIRFSPSWEANKNKKEIVICSHPKRCTPGSLMKDCYQITLCNITT